MSRSDTNGQAGRTVVSVAIIFGVVIAWRWSYVTASSLDPVAVYVETVREIAKDQKIEADDLVVVIGRYSGDDALVVNPRQALGMSASVDIMWGTPLKRSDIYKARLQSSTSNGGEIGTDARTNGDVTPTKKSPDTAGVAPPSELIAEMGIQRTGEKTWIDLAVSALELGREVYKEGTPLDTFLEAFAKKAGKESAEALSAGLRKLATDAYQHLTTEVPPITTPSAHFSPYSQTATLLAASGKVEISEHERRLAGLVEAARSMPPDAGCTIMVTGHTDTEGSDKENYELSEDRAKYIEDYLRGELPTLVINQRGWGERRLAKKTGDAKSALENRRVEVTLNCGAVPN